MNKHSGDISSRKRSVSQRLYNEFYEIAHDLQSDAFYDNDAFDDYAYECTPQSPNTPNIYSKRRNNNRLRTAMRRVFSASSNHRESFPNTTIVNFKSEEDVPVHNASHRAKETPTVTVSAAMPTDCVKPSSPHLFHQSSEIFHEKSSSKGVVGNCNNLCVAKSYAKTKKGSSTQSMVVPYPPNVTINVNDCSVDTQMFADREEASNIYEHTDNEETPAPPFSVTPQTTPGPISRQTSQEMTAVNGDENQETHHKDKKAPTKQTLAVSPMEESKSATNISSSCATSATTVSSESVPGNGCATEQGLGKRPDGYVKVNVTCTTMGRPSISKSWSADDANLDELNNANAERIKKRHKVDGHGSCAEPKTVTKYKSPSLVPQMNVSQNRSSASYNSICSNKIPRSTFNQRMEEMMLLMDEHERNTGAAKAIFGKYVDDVQDTQAIIDALETCLKDVMANLRDSFGRFLFTDTFERWSQNN